MFLRAVKRYGDFVFEFLSHLNVHISCTSELGISLLPHLRAQWRLLLSNAITAEDYYQHGLYADERSWEDKLSYLGNFRSRRYFEMVNPMVYDVLARDKVLFYLLANALEIPTIEIIAVTGIDSQPTAGERLATEAQLRTFLSRADSENIFFKPASGRYGMGALSIGKRIDGRAQVWQRLPDSGDMSQDEIIAHIRYSNGSLQRFLIQARVANHPLLEAICPNVLCTIRAMTFHANGTTQLVGAALRIGSGDEPTDNVSTGGLCAGVDPDSGIVGEGVQIVDNLPRSMHSHPKTGAKISGQQLPYWSDIRELLFQGAMKLSFIPLIGWDIAITSDGPKVVEINTMPRSRPIQVATGRGVLYGSFAQSLHESSGIFRNGLRMNKAFK